MQLIDLCSKQESSKWTTTTSFSGSAEYGWGMQPTTIFSTDKVFVDWSLNLPAYLVKATFLTTRIFFQMSFMVLFKMCIFVENVCWHQLKLTYRKKRRFIINRKHIPAKTDFLKIFRIHGILKYKTDWSKVVIKVKTNYYFAILQNRSARFSVEELFCIQFSQ